MVSQRNQLRTDEAFLCHQLHLAGMAQQLRGQEHGDVFDVFAAVAGGFLAFEIGVDRHLRDGASTDGVDEVDSGGAALRPDDVQR